MRYTLKRVLGIWEAGGILPLKKKDMNIAALISGGVDSAVAVHLLCEQGYKPDLFYIKIGMDTDDGLTLYGGGRH